MAGTPLDAPVISIHALAADAYFLAGADAGIFTFGPGAYFDQSFKGVATTPAVSVGGWTGPKATPAEAPWEYPTVVTSNGDLYGLW
jgi:hypothetical protein